MVGSGRNALIELTVTMLPRPAASMPGRTARVVRTAASSVRFSDADQSSSVTSRKPPRCGVTAPTLLTRTSRGPKASAAPTRSAGPSAVDRSAWTSTTRPSSTRSARSGLALRAPATTWAPSAASARAIARPIPLLAPVTNALRPSSPWSTAAPLAALT